MIIKTNVACFRQHFSLSLPLYVFNLLMVPKKYVLVNFTNGVTSAENLPAFLKWGCTQSWGFFTFPAIVLLLFSEKRNVAHD